MFEFNSFILIQNSIIRVAFLKLKTFNLLYIKNIALKCSKLKGSAKI